MLKASLGLAKMGEIGYINSEIVHKTMPGYFTVPDGDGHPAFY